MKIIGGRGKKCPRVKPKIQKERDFGDIKNDLKH